MNMLTQIQDLIRQLPLKEREDLKHWLNHPNEVREPTASYGTPQPVAQAVLRSAFAAETTPLKADADGVIRVAETRVRLDTVVIAFQMGSTPEEIAQKFPSLALPDIYRVIAYYLTHKAEVDAYLAKRQHEAQVLQREVEARWDPNGIRERLLARRSTKDRQ